MNAISVGIDASKGESMVMAMRPFGEVVFKPRKVLHTAGELESLAGFLKDLGGEVRAVTEATGRYHEPVAEALHRAGIFVSVVNPKLIKDYGNNTLRKVKTDKADAKKIARYGLEYWDTLLEYTPTEAVRSRLKQISRQLTLYTQMKTQLKNNLIAILDQTFPGANKLFSSPARADGHEKWVDFVATFWHCECVCGMSSKAFEARYQKWCERRGYQFRLKNAEDVYLASHGLVTLLPKTSDTKMLVTEAAKQLTMISGTVERFRAEMLRLARSLPEWPVVASFYGAGVTTGPQLMAEIGDVRRFSSRKFLIAFAGVDPGENQSGQYKSKSESTSKRGSSHLRRTLFQVVETYVKRKPQDEPVYQFYAKKRAEGKKYYVCTTAAANKFLRIYHARVKEYLESVEQNPPCQG